MDNLWARIRAFFEGVGRKIAERLVNKLILIFASIIVLVVVSLTFISYRMLANESFDSNVSGTGSNLGIVQKNLDKYLLEMDQMSAPQLEFEKLMFSIFHEREDYASQLFLGDYIRRLYYSRQDMEGVYLYLIDQRKYYYISRRDADIRVRVEYDPDGRIPETEWYKNALESPKNRSMQSLLVPADPGYPIDASHTFMGYHRILRNLADREPAGIVSFFFNPAVRDEIVGDIPLAPGEHAAYADADDTPYYWDDAAFFGKMRDGDFFERLDEAGSGGRFDWYDGERKYLVIYNRQATDDRKLVKAIPYEEINRAARTNGLYSLTIGLVLLLFALALVMVVSNAITRPLKTLSSKMNLFGDGFFDVEVEVKGRDEIAHLANRFNMMVTRTNELINERYRMKLVEKNAILKALKAEINPHFLYNALQAISTKSLKNGQPEITDMVDALALSMRYSISGKDVVTLREELRHIEHYFTIQKARFGDRLKVVYELKPEAYPLEIPKLSVHSLVENAIKHGLEKVSDAVTITIRYAKRDGEHVISVANDGPGIPDDRLAEIRRLLETDWEERESESIGMKNVHSRLRMMMGDRARLEIRTSDSMTEIGIVLPDEGDEPDV